MLRWYQRLGHDRQDERVVWLASGRHQLCERLQRRWLVGDRYGEEWIVASLACSDTNITTTDRSFAPLIPSTLSPCILLSSPLYSTPHDRFPFTSLIVLSFASCGKSARAAPLCIVVSTDWRGIRG